MKIETITGPAFAAPYFINGDVGDTDDAQRAALNAWLERNKIVNVIDVSEERFTRAWQLYVPEWSAIEPGATAGVVADYTCEVRS